MEVYYRWTDGHDDAFRHFYIITEAYYSRITGGLENRREFVPFNALDDIGDVLIAYDAGKTPVACAAFKAYSATDAEIKRVWVEPSCRRQHIAESMLKRIEQRIREKGFHRAILQTREQMRAAVALYMGLGYRRIENYPPYDRLDGAVCFAKKLV